jgi:hypothetical protein
MQQHIITEACANTNNAQMAINDLNMAAGYDPSMKKEAFTQISKLYSQLGNADMAQRYLQEAGK